MAAPGYMHDLRKSSQFGFSVYNWLQLFMIIVLKHVFGSFLCASYCAGVP